MASLAGVQGKGHENIGIVSPDIPRYRLAGATYASLIALVWENTLGKPDYGLLGVDPLGNPGAATPMAVK